MDLLIIESIQSVRNSFFDGVFSLITQMGEMGFFILVFSLLFWLYNKKYAINFALNYGAVAVFNSLILKNIFRRPRPFVVSDKFTVKGGPTGYSFPSGHSAGIASMTAYNVYESRKNKTAFKIVLPVAIVLCLMVGFSRMYLGVHYLTDVLVGLAIGWGVSYVMYRFVPLISEKAYKWFLIAFPVYFVLFFFVDSSKIYTFGAFAVSTLCGIYFENRFIKYDVNKYKNIWIKLLIGGGIFAAISVIFYFVPNTRYVAGMKNFSLGLVVTVLVPYVLSKLKGKDKMISHSEKDTMNLAKEIASKLKGGEVLLLNGDLGCGKSVFARGFITSLGVNEAITSPTFTIVNKYNSKKATIYHFDMYRLEEEEEAYAAGLDELIDEAGAIKLIEWPEKASSLLPENCIEINITKIDDNTRKFDIKGIDI